MPLRCASRYAGGMMVSARLRPIASCARPAERLLRLRVPGDDDGCRRPCRRRRRARCRGSSARAHRCAATCASASRRRSSAIATAIRFAVETAKFCSSTVHTRLPPTCSTQNTPITLVPRRSGTSSIAPMLSGSRYDAVKPLVRGSVLGVRSRDHALVFDGVEVGGRRLARQPRAGFVRVVAASKQPDALDRPARPCRSATG